MSAFLFALVVFPAQGFWSDGSTVYLGSTPISGMSAPVRQFAKTAVEQARVAWWTENGLRKWAYSPDGVTLNAARSSDYIIRLGKKGFAPEQQPPLQSGTNIIQFWTLPLPEYRKALEEAGCIVYRYLPDNAFLAYVPAKALPLLSTLPYIKWVGPYRYDYKLPESLLSSIRKDAAPTQRYSILAFKPYLKSRIAQAIFQLGGVLDDAGPHGHVLEATLTSSQLKVVAQMEEVMWVNAWTPAEHDMNIARQFSGADELETVAGYLGQGVRGQVRDGGVRATHSAFASRPLIILSNTTTTDHGTPTTGIIFGDGAGNTTLRGVLPMGQGIFRAGLATGSTRWTHTQTLIDNYQGVFESNSTGSARTLNYESESANMDDIIFDLDILICQSQSNAGNQMSRPQAWAKNIVSVGGLYHYNTLTDTDDTWTSSGASIGPASDGRLKPDLAHFYDQIQCPSYVSDTSYTSTFGGTSGATPITCGHFGLLFQMWADGVFGQTVTANSVFDARCHAMTAKALMINTARQWSFTGASAARSRVKQGWGAAHVKQLYDARHKMIVRNEEDILGPFEEKTFRVVVNPGEPALRVTMCYRDPMGNPAVQSQHRVNDLTLKVVSPSSETFYGNYGLNAGNWSVSGGTPNTKDTVENVFVQNPEAGIWTITVSGDEIVEDAYVDDGPTINAAFALVATGVSNVQTPNYTLVRGAIVSGSFENLWTSNNQYLTLRPGAVPVATADPIVLEGETFTGLPQVQTIRARTETRATATTIRERLQLLNYVTGNYDDIGFRDLTTSDVAHEYSAPGDQHIGAAGQIKFRIVYKPTGPVALFPWNISLDQVRIFIEP